MKGWLASFRSIGASSARIWSTRAAALVLDAIGSVLLPTLGLQRQRIGNVVDRPAVVAAPHRRPHAMRFASTDIKEVYDIGAAAHQGISHEGAVTPPPQRLRAHDCQPLLGFGPPNERLNGATECWRIHVIGIAAECRISECHMPRRRTPGSPATQYLALPLVPDATCRQTHRKRLTRELWMTARAREPPDVDQRGDTRLLQDREERLGRPSTMPHGQHDGHRFSSPR